MNDNPSVYVGTYAKYNSGSINGAWIDLSKFNNYDEFIDHCKKLHKDETDPELMFQDFENFPKSYYSESEIDADLWDEYINLAEHERELLEAYHDAGFEGGIQEAEDAFIGCYKDDEDFAWNMLENTGDLNSIPEHLQSYFDLEKYARDLMFDHSSAGGYYFTNN